MEAMIDIFGVPKKFSKSHGGHGYIMPTCGNCSVLTAHIAKMRKLKGVEEKDKGDLMDKLVGYFPDVSHSHAIKALSLNNFKEVREVPSRFDEDEGNFKMDDVEFRKIVEEDIKKGLIPTFMMSVVGATPTGGNDDLETLGKICKEFGIYMLVDAAWAGVFFVKPELRKYIKGLEYADSYLFNPSKMMLVGIDCAALYISDLEENAKALGMDLDWNQLSLSDMKILDTTKAGLFKLHFMFQNYGVEGMQEHIIESIETAKHLENLIRRDER